MLFLKTIKVLSLVFALLALPLWLVGFGILVTLPLLFFNFVLDSAINGFPSKSSFINSQITFNVAVVLAAAACALGLYMIFSLGTLSGHDQTPWQVINSVGAVIPVTIALFVIGNRQYPAKTKSVRKRSR